MSNDVHVDRNDAYDAFKCFAAVRNWFFVLFLLIPLLLLQGGFWVVQVGVVDSVLGVETAVDAPVAEGEPAGSTEANDAAADTADATEQDGSAGSLPKTLHTAMKIAYPIFMYVIPFSAVVYCLTLLIGMKLTLVGRLGAMAGTAKAFFLSLFVLVLVMPWPHVVGFECNGALFTYEELTAAYTAGQSEETALMGQILYYGRFVALWILILILLIMAQAKSHKSLKVIKQRIIGLPEEPESLPQKPAEGPDEYNEKMPDDFGDVKPSSPIPPTSGQGPSTPPPSPSGGPYDLSDIDKNP